MKDKILFSVVIPTRNRDTSLRNLLTRINEQSLAPSEIIIVDSSDKRQSHYGSIDKRIIYIHTTQRSAATQRNIGISLTKDTAQVLFFLDDDTSPYPKYFEDMMNTLFSFNAIGVSGLAINPENNARIKPKNSVYFINFRP